MKSWKLNRFNWSVSQIWCVISYAFNVHLRLSIISSLRALSKLDVDSRRIEFDYNLFIAHFVHDLKIQRKKNTAMCNLWFCTHVQFHCDYVHDHMDALRLMPYGFVVVILPKFEAQQDFINSYNEIGGI